MSKTSLQMIKIILNLFNRIYIGWAKVVIYSTHLGSNPIEVFFYCEIVWKNFELRVRLDP